MRPDAVALVGGEAWPPYGGRKPQKRLRRGACSPRVLTRAAQIAKAVQVLNNYEHHSA
ncbi:hypothetical protein [Glycomyces tarimensis]